MVKLGEKVRKLLIAWPNHEIVIDASQPENRLFVAIWEDFGFEILHI